MRALVVLLLSLNIYATNEKICENFYYQDKTIDLTDNERIFICGSKSAGWNNIPENQAKRVFKKFASSRGYFQVEFIEKDNKIFINLGKKSYISKVEFINDPPSFKDLIYKGAVGLELTESNLSEIKSWTEKRLDAIGYPCAEIEVQASYITGKVAVKIKSNDKVFINKFLREDLNDLNKESYSRHDAVEEGDLYNEDFLLLTSRRIVRSGMVSYSYFDHSCSNNGVIKQKVVLNKPNLIVLGVGASTEEFPILKASWKNSRMDKNGSSFQTLIYLSSVERSIEANFQYFPFRYTPRFYFKPFIKYEELTERIYETKSEKTGLSIGYNSDLNNYSLTTDITPSYNDETQIDGEAPSQSKYLATELSLKLTNHYFEYWVASPRYGDQYILKLIQYNGSNDEDSSVQGNQFNISGIKLFNIGSFDPPSTILGFRFHYSTLTTDSFEDTPQDFRLYLGGERDIRGFARKSINNSEKGFKTTAHFAIESRFTNILPYNLQPFIFYDLAKVGFKAYDFSDTLLYSPGVGMRWQSPFGSFRTTIAEGKKSNKKLEVKEQWNFFFSYGREF